MNIRELRGKLKLSQQGLADETGIPKGRIAQWEAGNANPKVEDTIKLRYFFTREGVLPLRDWNEELLHQGAIARSGALRKFIQEYSDGPDFEELLSNYVVFGDFEPIIKNLEKRGIKINRDELLETLKNDLDRQEVSNEMSKDLNTEHPNSGQSILTYQQQRNIQKNKTEPFMVPFMPIKAQAGYVRAIDQEMFIDNMEKYAIPPGVDYRGAIWRYWEVEGDSMEPTFHSNDIILTSQVHQMDWEQLRNFYLYVIVTAERVLFKRIYCKNELEWVLISENEENYPQQLLQAESVKEVWVYRRSIVNKAPPIKMFEIKI